MDINFLNRVIARQEKEAQNQLRKTDDEKTISAINKYLEIMEQLKNLINKNI